MAFQNADMISPKRRLIAALHMLALGVANMSSKHARVTCPFFQGHS